MIVAAAVLVCIAPRMAAAYPPLASSAPAPGDPLDQTPGARVTAPEQWGSLQQGAAVLQRVATHDALSVRVVVPRFLEAGSGPVAMHAQVSDGASAVPDGTAVGFVGSLGLRFDPPVAVTVGGVASTLVRPGTEAGFASIDAAIEGARGGAVTWVRPAPAARVVALSASPARVVQGARVRVVARLEDAHGNPADGDHVSWSADIGRVDPATSLVEFGQATTTFVAAATGTARVTLIAGAATADVVVSVIAAPAVPRIWLPLALGVEDGACRNLVINGGFEADRDGDGVPDGWRVEPRDGTAALVDHGADVGLRLSAPGSGDPPVAGQEHRVANDVAHGALRLWLRNADDSPAELRVAVWSMGRVGERYISIPLIVQPLSAGLDWTLEVLPLPAPPSGRTTLELSPRAQDGVGASVDVARVALEVCR